MKNKAKTIPMDVGTKRISPLHIQIRGEKGDWGDWRDLCFINEYPLRDYYAYNKESKKELIELYVSLCEGLPETPDEREKVLHQKIASLKDVYHMVGMYLLHSSVLIHSNNNKILKDFINKVNESNGIEYFIREMFLSFTKKKYGVAHSLFMINLVNEYLINDESSHHPI